MKKLPRTKQVARTSSLVDTWSPLAWLTLGYALIEFGA
jgi:hypothetical protein